MKQMTKLRKERGLSLRAFSRTANMHASSISQIETGQLKPYPGQIRKISEALGWDGNPADLFRELEP